MADPSHRVLLVDDDPDWREYLRLSLVELGYRVDEAEDGRQALRALDRIRYDVVVLDHYMPGMSGEEVARHLPTPAPKVVMLTNAGAEEVSSALGRGAVYYLPKSASQGELQLLLRSLVLA